ncbi:MAG: hypothetical protein UHO11_05110 [Treponema sp.]|nr:hypothetical protein [Treponema sp.]
MNKVTELRTKQKAEKLCAPVREGSVKPQVWSEEETSPFKCSRDWDGFASSMSSFDTWSGVKTSGAGALVTNCLGEMNLGTKVEKLTGKDGKTILNTIHTKVDGFNSSQIGSIQSFNSLVGGLATSALSYGLTGEATFNVLNISNFGAGASCGLLEVSVGNNGVKTRLGTGGTDVSVGTLLSAISGIKNLGMNEKIKKAAKENNMAQSATALRMLYGFGDDKGLELLDDVLNKKVSLAAGSGPGNAQTILENSKRTVYLNGYSNDMTREEKLKLGITLGHEAYRDGVKGDELTQKIETRNAVAGHTDMMTRMLGDSMYAVTLSGIIAGDRNLQLDLIARSLGDDVFNDYVDNCYDSSADYWRVVTDKNGNITNVQDDGDYEHFNVYDENGKKKGRFDNDGTSLTKQIADLGNGSQSQSDINYLMWHDWGLDYQEGKGWYAVDEKGSYQEKNTVTSTEKIISKITKWFKGFKDNNENEKDAKSYNDTIIKQKEIEQKFGYDNALCYGTTTINLYRLDSNMTDKQVDDYFNSNEVSKYISKPGAEIKSFEGLSNSISAFIGNEKYYDYVYPAENGSVILRYTNSEDFKKSSYQYGIGYYYKGTDYSSKPDHYELIVNNPYAVHNPGQQEYNLGWIYPVDKISIRKDWLK